MTSGKISERTRRARHLRQVETGRIVRAERRKLLGALPWWIEFANKPESPHPDLRALWSAVRTLLKSLAWNKRAPGSKVFAYRFIIDSFLGEKEKGTQGFRESSVPARYLPSEGGDPQQVSPKVYELYNDFLEKLNATDPSDIRVCELTACGRFFIAKRKDSRACTPNHGDLLGSHENRQAKKKAGKEGKELASELIKEDISREERVRRLKKWNEKQKRPFSERALYRWFDRS